MNPPLFLYSSFAIHTIFLSSLLISSIFPLLDSDEALLIAAAGPVFLLGALEPLVVVERSRYG